MSKPRIFISTVTRELKSTRQRIAAILTRKGYEPEWQDIFGTEPGDLRDMLRRKIESCHGLIQIIGDAYGAEPTEPDAQFGRCSYTQFEFLHARALDKKTWLLIADGDCARDPYTPEPADLRQLQRDYRQSPQVQQHLRHTAESDLALDLAIERMDDVLAELRREARAWQRTVLRLAAVIVLLVGVVLGVQVWMKKAGDKGIAAVLAGQKFDAPRIRAHFVESTERQRDTDLAAAEKAATAAERQSLREKATDAHAARLARIDEAVARFRELEGGAEATRVGRELTRILTDEGTDAALAYIEREKKNLLAEADAQLATDRERLRGKLAPLLSAADLLVTKGSAAAARTAYRELLQRDADWPEALRAYAWFLRDQSNQNERHTTLAAALADAEEAHALATRLHTADSTSPTAQRLLSATHNQMGDVLVKRQQDGDFAKIETHFTRSLDMHETLLKANPGSAQATRSFSISLINLGDFLSKRGQPGDADKALDYLTRSLELRETLLKANPGSAEAISDVCVSHGKMAVFEGNRKNTDAATKHYRAIYDLLHPAITQGMTFDPFIVKLYNTLKAAFGGK